MGTLIWGFQLFLTSSMSMGIGSLSPPRPPPPFFSFQKSVFFFLRRINAVSFLFGFCLFVLRQGQGLLVTLAGMVGLCLTEIGLRLHTQLGK